MKCVTVLKDKEEVKVVINTKIYKYKAILLSMEDFKDTNWIYIEGDPNEEISIFLKPKKTGKDLDLKILGLEFYNYVLGITENEL